MDELDFAGVVRGKRKRITTWPAELDTRPATGERADAALQFAPNLAVG
jgi:hypothetical protein